MAATCLDASAIVKLAVKEPEPEALRKHLDPKSRVLSEGIAEQTEQALTTLAAILEGSGSSMNHLVKTTVFCANVDDFTTINEIYARHMPDPPPARSAPANIALRRGIQISIEAIARVASD